MEAGIHLISHFAGTNVFYKSWDPGIFDRYSVPAVEMVAGLSALAYSGES